MIQTTPRDVRELRPGDLIRLVEATHRVVRVRQNEAAKLVARWGPHARPTRIPATEVLHEIVGEPGLIQTSIPHGAKVRFVIPI